MTCGHMNLSKVEFEGGLKAYAPAHNLIHPPLSASFAVEE
jgi:hypothetical protein